ncbi:MAG: DUF3127 domain-containing protein [Flavobacteriales bacterium]|nr:DUF3127 domain-containing protein [Flavobacteriales bacterium]NNK81094.1 DUF3127 domain-containing protein [Flavobacteriales bacterium]
MAFSITGKLKVINDTQQIKDTFRKREFVLTDDSSNYPQHISFQLIQDNCDLINGFVAGEEVKVMFNLRGREWTSPSNEVKYFNSLDAWKIERTVDAQPLSQPQASTENPPLPQEEDDLPF